ncbi:hypothetical protein [Companilactobacillus ginsenosidimutans]|uniref:Uncharacterized protein n=1 Tax=Companilactobacillus ginsenosidimutans TaxID=1007676 RepID=A0A0H4QL26_9LACO|nr:hypothetical protein [Companilactobacillus ginsenosidimutans]AKP67403.1 hypothetical protein ABM34_07550 [Companilactobacillus ginsenosidimutans]
MDKREQLQDIVKKANIKSRFGVRAVKEKRNNVVDSDGNPLGYATIPSWSERDKPEKLPPIWDKDDEISQKEDK